MKFKLFLSAALALTASSTAMASDLSGAIKLGQQQGRISNPIATQCSIVDKAQTESRSTRSTGDSSGTTSSGRAD